MDKKKQIDIVRKRNIDLTKQLENIKFKIEFDSQMNQKSYQHAKELIADLESIKSEWEKTLIELQKEKIEYDCLVADLKKIKEIMIRMNFKVPWYKKIFARKR